MLIHGEFFISPNICLIDEKRHEYQDHRQKKTVYDPRREEGG